MNESVGEQGARIRRHPRLVQVAPELADVHVVSRRRRRDGGERFFGAPGLNEKREHVHVRLSVGGIQPVRLPKAFERLLGAACEEVIRVAEQRVRRAELDGVCDVRAGTVEQIGLGRPLVLVDQQQGERVARRGVPWVGGHCLLRALPSALPWAHASPRMGKQARRLLGIRGAQRPSTRVLACAG
jgi:hypothetical protein